MNGQKRVYEWTTLVGSDLPFTNKTKSFIVIVGAYSTGTLLTEAAGNNQTSIQVARPDSTVIDGVIILATQSAVAPTATVTVYVWQLARRMLVPPNGQILSPGANITISGISIIYCDSLEDAIAAL